MLFNRSIYFSFGLSLEATKATVILSDIRLPLNWTKMKKAKSGLKQKISRSIHKSTLIFK